MTSNGKARSFGITDPGLVRGNNEDSIHFDDERGIYFVVDGMGGHAAGEQAALIATERLKGRLERATGTPTQRVREAITLANEAILEAGEKHPEWQGMACVLTVAVVENGVATVGHVGDSRLYKLAAGKLTKVTHDHSPVGELEDSGTLSEVDAMRHPRRNEVYRDVGSEHRDADDPAFIETADVPFEPESALLLCSDGLSDALPSAEILRLIEENAGDRAAAVRALVNAAMEEGKDNISAILVEGPAFVAASPVRKKRKSGPKRKPAAVTAPRAVALEALPQPVLMDVPLPRALPLAKRMGTAVLWFLAGIAVTLAAVYATQRWLKPAETLPAPVARHLLVPANFPNIAAAMDEARGGDTVDLAPREYQEAVRIKSGVTLRGLAPQLADTVLRPPVYGDASVALVADHTSNAVVSNLTIAGNGWLGGISITDGDLRVRGVAIVGTLGPGVLASGASKVTIDGSSIENNAGAGLLLKDTSSGSVTNNRVTGNGRAPAAKLPGIDIASAGSWIITGNRLANNGTDAIWDTQPLGEKVLEQNTFGADAHKGRLKDFRLVPAGGGQ